jgi:hypothetical protein
MWERTGDEATGRVYETPCELTAVTSVTGVTDGELTKDDPGTGMVTPDSVTTGVLQAGAGVYTV